MDGYTFYERVRILMHDKGLGYVVPRPYWTDDQIESVATSARDVIFTTLIEKAALAGAPLLVCNRMIDTCSATAGTAAPANFYRTIIGYVTNPYRYVLASGIPLGAALPGFDAVWVSAGIFRGTADTAVFYKQPTDRIRNTGKVFTDFPDGFYDTLVTLTAIELVMTEPQDAADRLDNLNDLFLQQMNLLV